MRPNCNKNAMAGVQSPLYEGGSAFEMPGVQFPIFLIDGGTNKRAGEQWTVTGGGGVERQVKG